MSNRLKKWFHNVKIIKKILKREPQPEPPMPTLPPERARPLTAVPCSPTATENSALFQRIPAEIRRQILIEAFGEFPIDFSLRLLPPPKRNATPKPDRDGRLPHANFISELDCSAPRQWEWRSSVCHNLRPNSRITSWWEAMFDDSDCCYMGSNSECHSWPGDFPIKCYIGAIGWLLACRLAYIEGIEVLYATNRIRIRQTGVFRRLPDLLLPQRLATIRSVQLFWNIHAWRDTPMQSDSHIYEPGSDMGGLTSLLEALPTILPNLTFLSLSLKGDWKPILVGAKLSYVDEVILNSSEVVLQLIDEMVIKLHRLSECHIFLPASYFRARKFKEKGIGFTSGNFIKDDPLWRALTIKNSTLPDLRSEFALAGYWIRVGQRDWMHPDDVSPSMCGL